MGGSTRGWQIRREAANGLLSARWVRLGLGRPQHFFHPVIVHQEAAADVYHDVCGNAKAEPFVDSDGRISLVDSEPEPSKTALAGKLLNELHTAPPGSRTATRLVQIKLTDEQLAGRRLRFDGQIANEGTTPAHDEILVPVIELLSDRPSTLEPPKHVVNLGLTDQGNVILVPNVARERSRCLDVVMQRQRPDID